MPHKFTCASLCAGLLYAIGGFDGVSPLKSMESYDPTTNRWASLPDMATKRFGLGACAVDGKYLHVELIQCFMFEHAQ